MTTWTVTYKRVSCDSATVDFYAKDFEDATQKAKVAISLVDGYNVHTIIKLELKQLL